MALEKEAFMQKTYYQAKPIRLDFVQVGIEVLSYLAESKGFTYDDIIGRNKKLNAQRTKIKREFLSLVPQPLNLTRSEIAAVFRRNVSNVSNMMRSEWQIALKRGDLVIDDNLLKII